MVMEVVPVPGQGFSSNVYLVKGEKNILIDAGLGIDVKQISSVVSRALGSEKLDAIILTHRHMDHIGGAGKLASMFDARVYSGSIEAQAINTRDMESTCAYAFGLELPDINVQPVETMKYRNMRIIDTPGHTAGSICIYFPKERWLFSGDTVFLHGSTGRWDLPTGNLQQLSSSIERLSALEIEGLFPGHEGYVEEGGSEHIALALQFLRGGFID
jgi:glyoxylase-like metal-dependent hydrolase (beta-lactamase superfamily II)